MPITIRKIDLILKNKSLSRYKLSKIIGCAESTLSQMASGHISFSEKIIQQILPILEVSREEFESWLLADKYSKEILELAIKNKKEFPHKRKSMLTTKLNAILKEKGLSRTDLSKKILYNQSGLNRMIIGKINMSKSVIERVSKVLEISQEEIFSWILVDKYSLELLEMAWACKG